MSEDTLDVGEIHPSSYSALEYIKKIIKSPDMPFTMEALASCALSGNRQAQICLSTISRLISGSPVSDRYLLGLAWFLMEMQKEKIKKPRAKKCK